MRTSYHSHSVESHETAVRVRWPPACEDVNPETEDRSLLDSVVKAVTENTSLYVIVICRF
jgi:hypothetical protein